MSTNDGINPTDHDLPDGSNASGTLENVDSGEAVSADTGDTEWLRLALQNYTTGVNYLNASLVDEWERNIDHWNSTHYRRSAYSTKAFRGRSALFRPLSRASERSSSATAAASFFSNKDLLNVSARNPANKSAAISAKWMQQIMQYRLQHDCKWYMNLMGAWQSTRVMGPCAAFLDWEYEDETIEVEEEVPVISIADTEIPDITETETHEETIVLRDGPKMDLLPMENVLYDPACDWTDPAQSSVFLTILFPMYVTDVKTRMVKKPGKAAAEWFELSTEQILSATQENHSTVRQAREGDNRPDSKDSQEGNDNQVVWPRLNFVRKDGVDWVYWTMGHEFMLTEAKPVIEVYQINARPVVIGTSVIEIFQMSPSSPIKMIAPLQQHVNDISNLRLDNVKLALNKRYILRRSATIDLQALMLNVPGGGITTDDPERDIKVIQTPDVTSSSYREQERLETESNDVFGVFLGGSVQNNRQMRETVGGMEMLKEGKSELSEFDIRTFTESFVKPLLQMLLRLIQARETDEVIMNFAWDKMIEEAPPELTMDIGETEGEQAEFQEEIKEYMMNNEMVLEVNVGIGATSPQQRIETLMFMFKAVGDAAPEMMQKIEASELWKEIFSIGGQADGSRFLKDDTEEPEITEEQLEQAKQEGIEQGKNADKMARVEMEERVGMAKLEMQERVAMAQIDAKVQVSTDGLDSLMEREDIKSTDRRDLAAISSKDKRDIAAANMNQKERELTSKEQGLVDKGI